MTGWWQQPYRGAPGVKVSGFPRPLYPPDASKYGKKASVDGPDVLAYKRTISRLARWPWQKFDDTYSNSFSHGKTGGNVGDSGVAGFQRQQHIDATGWFGKNTFDTLRCALIPDGKPHAGEYGMDAYAVELVNQAWGMFGGHEPAPDSKGTLRQAALEQAITQIGVKESPPESNLCKYTDWYGMVGPWCAMFATWAFETKGDSPAFVQGARYAYVPYIVSDGQNGRNGLKVTDDPIPGDLVAYDWGWDGTYDHVGIFEGWVSGTSQFTAIEGNTSTSNDSNGGEVMRRTRNRTGQATVFVRVQEP